MLSLYQVGHEPVRLWQDVFGAAVKQALLVHCYCTDQKKKALVCKMRQFTKQQNGHKEEKRVGCSGQAMHSQ